MKRSITMTLLGLAALLPCLALAQASIPTCEFSSAAADYPVNATTNPTYSLQGTMGQTFATIDPPASSGQNIVATGFGETDVPFAYIARITLDGYIGRGNPDVTYGLITGIPFTAEMFNISSVSEGILPSATFFADATGKVKILSSMNPAFAQTLSVKGPIWLRRNAAITLPSDPVNGYPSASLLLLAGDANGDNFVDIADFGVLVNAYPSDVNLAGSGYNPNADFNQDGVVDIADFGLLVNHFALSGD